LKYALVRLHARRLASTAPCKRLQCGGVEFFGRFNPVNKYNFTIFTCVDSGKNGENLDQIPGNRTPGSLLAGRSLYGEDLNPGALEPFLPTHWEKNLIY
jgi:hypothetical protein